MSMRIEQIYNGKSFYRFKDQLDESIHLMGRKGLLDAFPGVVLKRQLTFVNPRIFEKKYP